MMWRCLELDIEKLVLSYIDKIAIKPSVFPVYSSSNINFESCALIGFDLLPSNNELFFIESNFNAGFGSYRLEIFPDGDPVCVNLIQYATQYGFKKILFNPFSYYSVFSKEIEEFFPF